MNKMQYKHTPGSKGRTTSDLSNICGILSWINPNILLNGNLAHILVNFADLLANRL